jgi:hypothetical protein
MPRVGLYMFPDEQKHTGKLESLTANGPRALGIGTCGVWRKWRAVVSLMNCLKPPKTFLLSTFRLIVCDKCWAWHLTSAFNC